MSFVRSNLSLAILATLTTSAIANETPLSTNNENNPTVELNTIVVEADKNNEVGKTAYSKEDLEKIPNSSKNITDFLKVNPNVQLSNTFKSGLKQGELSAADISINGSLPYENKILVNGMNINNQINPIGNSSSVSATDLMSSTQNASVNTDLLCNISVLDSNISAEYGEFTGGVVSAETCKPTTKIGSLHGSINYDYTSDDWSKINFTDEESRIEFEDSKSSALQPYFTKQGVSATLYGNLTEELGFNTFSSYRHSVIPLKTNFIEPNQINQKREAINFGAELFYTPSPNTQLKIGSQFFENEGHYFQENTLNSNSKHNSDSQSFYINLKNNLDSVVVDQQLNYQTNNSSKNANTNMYTWLRSSTKDWHTNPNIKNQSEGAYGSLNQEEQKVEYSVKALFEPLETKNSSHQFKIGGGYGHYEAYWERPETSTYYLGPSTSPNIECTNPSDGSVYLACDEGNGKDGQFLKTRWTYLAGKINIQQDRWHVFVEDNIKFTKKFETSLGFRSDYDSLTKNNNVAPRSSFTFKPFDDNRLKFSAGWNRYYGLNAFSNELQDRKGLLNTQESRKEVNGKWTSISSYSPLTYFRSKLDTPYSDEIVFGINGYYNNINAGIKFVNRSNKDQIRRAERLVTTDKETQQAIRVDKYDNSGTSQSDTLTINLNNIEPLTFKNTQHHISLSADITQTERNFETYDEVIYTGTPEIYYDGQKIKAEDKPAEDFNMPWTVRVNWNIGFDKIPLNINNYFSYNAPTPAMKYIRAGKDGSYEENGTSYDTFIPYEAKKSFNWDMRTTYAIPNLKNTKTILGLTINNRRIQAASATV